MLPAGAGIPVRMLLVEICRESRCFFDLSLLTDVGFEDDAGAAVLTRGCARGVPANLRLFIGFSECLVWKFAITVHPASAQSGNDYSGSMIR
jgi:hypothetical protein